MIRIPNDRGDISISSDVYTAIVGETATNCFGVKGMAMRSVSDGLVHLLKRESMSKGVYITYNEDSTISVELHIVCDPGVNLQAVGSSLVSEVRYKVTNMTGTDIRSVDIFVDSIIFD